jgi:hypothetical protein
VTNTGYQNAGQHPSHQKKTILFMLSILFLLLPFSLFAQDNSASSPVVTTDSSANRKITLVNELPATIQRYYTAGNLAAALPESVGNGNHIKVTIQLTSYNSMIVRAELGRFDAPSNNLRLLAPGTASSHYAIAVSSIHADVVALAKWAQGTSAHTDVPDDVVSALSNHHATVVCRFTNSRQQWIDFVLYEDRVWPPSYHFKTSLYIGGTGSDGTRIESQTQLRENKHADWTHLEYYYLDPLKNPSTGRQTGTQQVLDFFH